MKKGIVYNLSNKDYHADKSHYSSSGLKLIYEQKIKEFHKQYILGERVSKQEDHFDLGTAFHTKVFEPEKYEAEIAHYSGAIKRGKKYEQFLLENPGKIILRDMQVVELEKMVDAISRHTPIQELLQCPGVSELSFFTTINNLPIKVRPDRISFEGGFLLDGKTFKDIITRETVMAEIKYRHYDLAAALYIDAVNSVLVPQGYKEIKDFYWPFASKKNGKAVLVKALPETLEVGREKYRKAIMDFHFYEEIKWKFEEKEEEKPAEIENEVIYL